MSDEQQLTHIDEKGDVRMVDVSAKAETQRVAVAEGFIAMHQETLDLITSGQAAKGDVLACARVAGIMASKRTSDLIPMCHPLMIGKTSIDFRILEESCEIECLCTAKLKGQTGVEMEALTGVSVALLTIYDMCKAIDKRMEIGGIHLAKKTGGKSGSFINDPEFEEARDD